jgi:hypothetical protein
MKTPNPSSPSQFLARVATDAIGAWNQFWFAAVDPATLGLLRILGGAMLVYTHAVWTIDLAAFFGPDSWVSLDTAQMLHRGPEDAPGDLFAGTSFVWSVFFFATTPKLVWAVHIATLIACTLLTLGLFTRPAAVLTWILAVSYVHRTPGALFGLDQINTLLAFALMIGPSGACYSLDSWLRRRKAAKSGTTLPAFNPSIGANVALRLVQLHMCVVYMFAGIGKLTGVAWWNGTGLWGAVANLEYQSLDATWLAWWPAFGAFMSHLTVYWEIYYPVLIWPRATRPWMLLLAIPLHLGIAFFMGMITFGLVMLIGNFAFVRPETTRALLCWLFRRSSRPQWQAANVTSKVGKALA